MKAGSLKKGEEITPPKGKLGVLIPGIGGAVSTTFIAGVELVRRGLAEPVGSLTQLGTIRLGKRFEHRSPKIKDFVPLADLSDMVFGGWDIYEANCFEAALYARVLRREHLDPIKDFLSGITPMKAVFDRRFVKNLDGTHVKDAPKLRDKLEELKADIPISKPATAVDRCIMIWCGSTEIHLKPGEIHQSIGFPAKGGRCRTTPVFRRACSMPWPPWKAGSIHQRRAEPHDRCSGHDRTGGLRRRAHNRKDFKTGQTLMKTILAPGLKSRMLGLEGWYSTNILGNRDGLVAGRRRIFKTKEESKLSVLDIPLAAPTLPGPLQELLSQSDDKLLSSPRRQQGRLGLHRHLRMAGISHADKGGSFLPGQHPGRTSDSRPGLFMDLAQRSGMSGIQEWLSFYFKSPMVKEGLYPEHDLFIQSMKLKNTLRYLMDEEQITHFGLDYYMEG